MKKTLKIFALMLIAVLALAALVACGGNKYPTNPEDAQKALEKDGYKVRELDEEELGYWAEDLGVAVSDFTAIFEGYKEDGNVVMLFYFKDSAAADKAWDSDFTKELLEAAKTDKNLSLEKNGTMIIMNDIMRMSGEDSAD